MATPSLPVKSHSSPSKTSYGRTYDSKLVSREMHRLGNLTAAPPSAAAAAASASSLALPAPPQPSLTATPSADAWGTLHVHVLPLFNGEPLRIPIEDLNVLVRRHIQSVVTSSPSKALSGLENDAGDLIASGMVTLNAKLAGVDDDNLLGRVVEIWGFFWDQVLTYLQGVLLPLHTDALLLALARPPPRQSAPSHIDVRSVALRSFRDKVILPLAPRIYQRLALPHSPPQPRLHQMLLVLSSQRRPCALAFSLTAPPPTPTPGEQAIIDLLRVSHSPHALNQLPPVPSAPSFLSGGLPRDRRGRIAHKQNPRPRPPDLDQDALWDETPRGGLVERERDRELLESLRSPDLVPPRASVGGWGLGEGHEDVSRTPDDEDDDPLL